MIRRQLAVKVGHELKNMGIPDSAYADVWFDEVRLKEGKVVRQPIKKSSRELLQGMMGIETDAIMEVAEGLVSGGMKKTLAQKKAKTYVNSVKRRCLKTLHHLFITTKDKCNQRQ